MIKVAVVNGGYSDEYVISLKSAQLIFDNLDREKYEVHKVCILNEGWFALDETDKKYEIDKRDFSFIKNDEKYTFDVAFNIIHGTPGEDGHMQAYWELIDLPYTGCSFYQSALTFNKKDTLSVLTKYNIPKAKSVYITQGEIINKELIAKELGLPCFVKPNQSGSSLGVTKVKSIEDFDAAFKNAFAEDPEILVESELKGREISVGVIQWKDEIKVLGITEIISETEFFDYDAKYNGKSKEITPADFDKDTENRIKEMAIKVYKSLGMRGFSRTDYIVVDGIPHFIEMNTLPGLSPASILPQQALYSKIAFKDLFDNEIQIALKQKPIWKK